MRFRLQALAHQGEPEELDVVPKLVRSHVVIAVILLGAIVAGISVWSFVGELPRRVTLEGLLVSNEPLNTVQSTVDGIVVEVPVQSNDAISEGDPLVTVVAADGEHTTIDSPFDGTAISVSVAVGQPVEEGTLITTVQSGEPAGAGLHAVVLVPSQEAAQIAPGMDVKLAVSSAPSAAFGLLRGTVESVSASPLTSGEALALFGNDVLVQELVGDEPVNQVVIAVDSDPDTASGYAWTTADGPPFPVFPQTLVTATVQTGDQRPIDVVFGR